MAQNDADDQATLLHFTYRRPCGDLQQGDILEVTPEIREILQAYHPYYVLNERNRYFLVLTQSCDLVRRSSSDKIAARYIAIAPVRQFQETVERLVEERRFLHVQNVTAICADRERSRLNHEITRIINNNYPEHFFLLKQPEMNFPDDCCAILRLAVSIRAEHYSKLLDARVLQLTETFQAKLGFLVGNIYSRVGTQDWPSDQQKRFISEILNGAAYFVPDKLTSDFKRSVDEWHSANEGRSLDIEGLDRIKRQLPTAKARVMERIEQIFEKSMLGALLRDGTISEPAKRSFFESLKKDQIISDVLKRA